jgi:sulfite dehydrogenase (cytochrome) subunit A
MERKVFLMSGLAAGAASAWSPASAAVGAVDLPFENGTRPVAAYPQKRPLIVLTTRPVQLETPFSVFDDDLLTPNDAFFVRWHLAGVPDSIDAAAFRIRVHGNVATEQSFSLSDLRRLPPVEITAVCECSGNSRGFFSPRVPGGQWANGAMGNARWKGARLSDLLQRAGVKEGSAQVRFSGADQPVEASTPKFKKSLDMDLALASDTIVAYEMNGKPLPLLNGYPVRLVVPGYFATYWVKMLNDVEVLTQTDDNYWMKTAYRIPATPTGGVAPGATGFETKPIGKLTVRSFVTSLADGDKVGTGRQIVRGIAFDSGSGIATVEFSADGGTTWRSALLGPEHGRYGFRAWTAVFTAERGGRYPLVCRATSRAGETQSSTPVWNPAGYLRNVPEQLTVTA